MPAKRLFPQPAIYLRVSAPSSKPLLTTLHGNCGKQPFSPKGSKCLQSASFHNTLYICALAHLLQNHYLLPFTENTEKPSFRRRVVSARKSQTLQVSDLQHFVKRGSIFYLLPFMETAEKQRNVRADGLYRLRKTLAPEKGGDPPQGGEDFPGRYRPSASLD